MMRSGLLIICSCDHLEQYSFHGWADAWTNLSLQDKPWAEFSTLEVAACIILYTYCLL
jgi:hypothetical protein